MRVSQKVYFDKILKPTISVSAAMFTNWASKKSKKCQERGGGVGRLQKFLTNKRVRVLICRSGGGGLEQNEE